MVLQSELNQRLLELSTVSELRSNYRKYLSKSTCKLAVLKTSSTHGHKNTDKSFLSLN